MKNKIFSIVLMVLVMTSMSACFEVDEPVRVVEPPASIVFNNNALTDGGTFSIANGVVNFTLTVTQRTGTITSVNIANRYTITGVTGTRVHQLGDVSLTNGTATISLPISSLRAATDPAITFANRGNNSIRVTVNTSEGPTVRFFNLNLVQ
jgi:hypothetical protein